MRQFNVYKTMMKYLTDENLSLNAKGLLSIVLFQDEIVGTEIEKLCTDNKETIKDALLELRINKYIKYDTESGKLIAAPTPYTEWDKDDYELQKTFIQACCCFSYCSNNSLRMLPYRPAVIRTCGYRRMDRKYI